MSFWLQQCPDCGYCYSDISANAGLERAFVESAAYQRQRLNCDYPPLANAFLCKSMVEEITERFSKAAWSALHAAWVCDDFEQPERASTCRRRALRLRASGSERGETLSNDEEVDLAVVTDLYRRIGDHHAVCRLATEALRESTNETLGQILRFQMALAVRGDAECYTMGDAFKHERCETQLE